MLQGKHMQERIFKTRKDLEYAFPVHGNIFYFTFIFKQKLLSCIIIKLIISSIMHNNNREKFVMKYELKHLITRQNLARSKIHPFLL